MYSGKLKISAAAVTLLFLIALLPQDGLSGEILDLNSAIRMALEKNYGITLKRNELEIARRNNSAGNAGFLPRIDATADYNKSTADAMVNTLLNYRLDNPAASSDLVNAGVLLRWTLFDGFNMFANSKSLQIMEQIGELNLKIAIENTIAKIVIHYFDIVKQIQLLSLRQEQVSLSEFRTQIAQLNFATGMGSEFELMKAEVEMNFDKLSLEKQSTALANAKIVLNELLSRDVNTEFTIQDSIVIMDVPGYDALRKSMVAANNSLLLANKNKQMSEQEAKKILARFYPAIEFRTGYTYYDLQTEASFITETRTYGYTFGLNASINLFDGLNDRRKTENARVRIANSELMIRELLQALDSSLARIYQDYTDGLKNIEMQEINLKLARKNMEIASESFANGSISSLQFREVQQNLLDANTMLVTARYNVKAKQTELLLLSGQLLYPR